MRIVHDEDEWETVGVTRPCTTCGGDLRKCNGGCNGMSSISARRRDPSEVARLRFERQRVEEDEILRRAKVIQAARKAERLSK